MGRNVPNRWSPLDLSAQCLCEERQVIDEANEVELSYLLYLFCVLSRACLTYLHYARITAQSAACDIALNALQKSTSTLYILLP